MVPFLKKLYSLVFLSSGEILYIQTSSTHELFSLNKLQSIFVKKKLMWKKFSHLPNLTHLRIPQMFFSVVQLPKNIPVCLIELTPGRGLQYAKSVGVKSVILKMDSRVSTSLIRLPSGVKKTFSIFSSISLGTVALSDAKYIKNTGAGRNVKFGRKPIVRGVAKNPFDHPHGGQAKSIKYQRTP